jgi:lysophospholipase L1-like esterase
MVTHATLCLIASIGAFTAATPIRPRIVVALGDSTTAGTPYFSSPKESPPKGYGNPEAPYPYWAGKDLPGWKVLNRGINGQRSDEIRARFKEDVILTRPRYVVILAGVNDVYQGIPSNSIQNNLLWMYRKARESGIVPIAATILPFDLASEEQSRRIEDLNTWILKTAKLEGIPACDLHRVAADPRNPTRLRGSPEGLHPDLPTYEAIAMGHAVADLIRQLEKKEAAQQ